MQELFTRLERRRKQSASRTPQGNQACLVCRQSSVLDFHRTPRRSLTLVGGEEHAPNILLRAVAAGMTRWWRRELVLTDQGLEWDAWSCERLVKMTLPYERITAVDVLWGPYADDVRVAGISPDDTLLVIGLDKTSAARIKSIVERRITDLQAA